MFPSSPIQDFTSVSLDATLSAHSIARPRAAVARKNLALDNFKIGYVCRVKLPHGVVADRRATAVVRKSGFRDSGLANLHGITFIRSNQVDEYTTTERFFGKLSRRMQVGAQCLIEKLILRDSCTTRSAPQRAMKRIVYSN